MDRETRLGILAASILDGTPVDWSRAESTELPGDREVVDQLHVLSRIAALHRASSVAASDAVTGAAVQEPVTWGHLRGLTLLGHGAYGDVYRAWDPHLERAVALKLLRAGPSPGAPGASISDPARVVDEGRLLARVRHPHVITVYGAEPRDGVVGLWMELIEGRTLQQLVEANGPLGAREATGIGLDLCRALAAVHAAGLVHRDVTARNVMREEGGRIVLMDFGAGRDVRTDLGGAAATLAGTPLYMAPEVVAGGAADQRSDIYSLGVLLYFAVSGRFPVVGRSLDEIRTAHAGGVRARLRDARPDLPAAFVRAVERAIAAAPHDRFATAGEFESALDQPTPVTGSTSPRASTALRFAMGTAAAVATAAIAWMATGASRNASGPAGGGTPPSTAAAVSVTMRRLAAIPVVSRPSNPSADGRFIAASSWDLTDAVVVDLATGEVRPLGINRLDPTDSDGYASITVLSPDGAQVAVNWWRGRNGSLRIVGADGSGPRTLVAPDGDGDATPYQWSRDGSMLLAAIVDRTGVATIALVATADGAVRPLRRLAGWVNELPEQMSLSPDGRYIAYDHPESATSTDRDIVVLDAHTGEQWVLDAPAGHDTSPLWSPDGRELVFVSDRNRSLSLWAVAMEQGRPQGEPRLVKDDVGRIRARGFTADGVLHVDLTAGHPEVYVARLDSAAVPTALSPRLAFGNFYPSWSHDGRLLAYTSERNERTVRTLWVYDTGTDRESTVPLDERIGRVVDWSPDGTKLLVSGDNNPRLSIVDRATGRMSLLAGCVRQARWLPEGIVCEADRRVILRDPATGRTMRTLDFNDPGIAGGSLGLDGRTVIAERGNGRLVLHDVRGGTAREWQDPGVTGIGRHAMAPFTGDVAYVAFRHDATGDSKALMVWRGAGDPRELLRVRSLDAMALEGWAADGLSVLITRWTASGPGAPPPPIQRSLWRVPTTGGPAAPTGLVMEGLRDVSLRPDGRSIAFNAGWKKYESWTLEHLLPE
ncbi:MAG: protein kinase [Vicinamibacterales bacterium]